MENTEMAGRFLICIYTVFFVILVSEQSKDQKPKNLMPLMGVKPSDLYKSLRQGPQDLEGTTISVEPPKNCMCSKIYDPVCASNNKSYYNPCQMECDVGKYLNVTIIHQGNCIPF